MALLDRFRRSRAAGRLFERAERLLAAVEADDRTGLHPLLVRETAGQALEYLDLAEAAGYGDADHAALRRGQALFLLGRVEEAHAPAHAAASARPYDVESRISLGLVCLALDRFEAARHEFEAILEENGRDPEAMAGIRATALAQGALPEGEDREPAAREEDRDRAADLLLRAWDARGETDARLDGLRSRGAPLEIVDVLASALARRRRGAVRWVI